MSSASEHLSALKPKIESGLWVMGGASLEEPLQEGKGMKANGSVMLASADTQEEVMEAIKSDAYYKNGIWDHEKVSSSIAPANDGRYPVLWHTPMDLVEIDRCHSVVLHVTSMEVPHGNYS